MELWNFGILEFWNFGILEFWNFGILEFWKTGIFITGMFKNNYIKPIENFSNKVILLDRSEIPTFSF